MGGRTGGSTGGFTDCGGRAAEFDGGAAGGFGGCRTGVLPEGLAGDSAGVRPDGFPETFGVCFAEDFAAGGPGGAGGVGGAFGRRSKLRSGAGWRRISFVSGPESGLRVAGPEPDSFGISIVASVAPGIA
ncbi:MAG TPA: hypothetical protein VGX23_29730 [Actinocrinis sp.]|nr:hypothetical protein [Actinocrinis sp.]